MTEGLVREGNAESFARHVNPTLLRELEGLGLDREFVSGRDGYLTDAKGREYLDFLAGFGALPLGHSPDAIWREILATQASSEPLLAHMSVPLSASQLATDLVALTGGRLNRVALATTGSEAVEVALKIATTATGKTGLLSAIGSYHGQTRGALSINGDAFFRDAFGPVMPGVTQVSFGDLESLDQMLRSKPNHFAAFIIEPIQGEGGMVASPAGYLHECARVCREHGVLLVLDEVQTGLGRTGALFAADADAITPDILVLGKALGGGLAPISAVLYRSELATETFLLRHQSTFAGHAIACRAAIRFLRELTADGGALVRNAHERGSFLLKSMSDLTCSHSGIMKDVRGRGLMIGIELHATEVVDRPRFLELISGSGLMGPLFAGYLLNVHGIRIGFCLSRPDVLRVQPPLNVTQEQCESFVESMRAAVEAFETEAPGRILRAIGSGCRPEPGVLGSSVRAPQLELRSGAEGRRFAFVHHPIDRTDLKLLDPSLAGLSADELERWGRMCSRHLRPFVFESREFTSPTGIRVFGEFIAVPQRPLTCSVRTAR